MSETWNTTVRVSGFCTLLVLAFHSTSVLALDHDPGYEHHRSYCKFLDVPLLQPDLETDLPPPFPVGLVTETRLPATVSTLPSLHTSRGPPA